MSGLRTVRTSWWLVLALVLDACSAKTPGVPGADMGSGVDSGTRTDSGTREDAGMVAIDSGGVDAGAPRDMGVRIDGGPRVREHLLLEADFEGSDPFGDFDNNQSCCDHSVTQSTEQARNGTHSFRAEVRASDPAVSSGWRAEIVPRVGDTGDKWYGWSMYFEAPADGDHWTGSYGGHFVQWHPDNGSGSASLSLWGSEGVWDVATNPEGDETADHHGDEEDITAFAWHDVVFHVNWDEGIVQFWLDGELYVDLTDIDYASGPGQYMKFGMNRWGSGSGGRPTDTWVIFYDDLRIGDGDAGAGYDDVAP